MIVQGKVKMIKYVVYLHSNNDLLVHGNNNCKDMQAEEKKKKTCQGLKRSINEFFFSFSVFFFFFSQWPLVIYWRNHTRLPSIPSLCSKEEEEEEKRKACYEFEHD